MLDKRAKLNIVYLLVQFKETAYARPGNTYTFRVKKLIAKAIVETEIVKGELKDAIMLVYPSSSAYFGAFPRRKR